MQIENCKLKILRQAQDGEQSRTIAKLTSKYFLETLFVQIFLCVCVLCAYSVEKEKEKTIITGNRMEMQKTSETVIFSDGATINQGKSVLKAKNIVHDKKNGVANASENVVLETYNEDNELVKTVSGQAKYYFKTSDGQFWENRPMLYYFAKRFKDPVTMQADNINFSKSKGQYNAFGSVEVISSSGCAYASNAIFYENEKRLVLDGMTKPYLLSVEGEKKDKFEGDKITYLLNEKKIRFEGNVKGYIKNYKIYQK